MEEKDSFAFKSLTLGKIIWHTLKMTEKSGIESLGWRV